MNRTTRRAFLGAAVMTPALPAVIPALPADDWQGLPVWIGLALEVYPTEEIVEVSSARIEGRLRYNGQQSEVYFRDALCSESHLGVAGYPVLVIHQGPVGESLVAVVRDKFPRELVFEYDEIGLNPPKQSRPASARHATRPR